jgi:hypothetical protein
MVTTLPDPKEKLDDTDEKGSNILTSDEIISDTFRSFDKQIEKLDKIPKQANQKGSAVLALMFSDIDIFAGHEGQLKFINCLKELSEEVGQAFDTILEIEFSKQRGSSEQTVIMPMPSVGQSVEKPNPSVILQSQPPKGGGWADYFGVRRWSGTMEKIFANKQTSQSQGPQSTTSRVIDILDYGRELVSEYNLTLDFYSRAIDHLYFFHDSDTYERQHKQLAIHLTKIVNIICSFSRAIVEYRKERFGDRKVGVAAGAMWLEAAKAQSLMGNRPYISPLSPPSYPLGRKTNE